MNFNELSLYISSVNINLKKSEKNWEIILDTFEQYYFKNEKIIEFLNNLSYKNKNLNNFIFEKLQKSYIFYNTNIKIENFSIFVYDNQILTLEFCLLNKRYKLYTEDNYNTQRIVNFLLKKDFHNYEAFL